MLLKMAKILPLEDVPVAARLTAPSASSILKRDKDEDED